MIILLLDEIQRLIERGPGSHGTKFRCCDGGDVYTMVLSDNSKGAVRATIRVFESGKPLAISRWGKASDQVRIAVTGAAYEARKPDEIERPYGKVVARGYVRHEEGGREVPVQVIPVRQDIFSRIEGLFETGILAEKRVFQAGVGSGGAPVIVELAKSGVSHFDVMDHDRLEVANIVRHHAGLSDVGRYKTKYIAEAIREKNPYANVQTWEIQASWDTGNAVRQCVRRSDIVVCATDNRESRLVINKLCVEEGKPCIFAAAFRRAYGGQVLFVRPGVGPCYQCFLDHLPEAARDQEISRAEQAERLAYTDRPVPLEPGLSTDIAPISLMVAKLAITELLRGTTTTLQSLEEDLVAPWYVWLNRREAGTDYEKLPPLGSPASGMRILRWYGIQIERNTACPACGDFATHTAHAFGVTLTEQDIDGFAPKQDRRECA